MRIKLLLGSLKLKWQKGGTYCVNEPKFALNSKIIWADCVLTRASWVPSNIYIIEKIFVHTLVLNWEPLVPFLSKSSTFKGGNQLSRGRCDRESIECGMLLLELRGRREGEAIIVEPVKKEWRKEEAKERKNTEEIEHLSWIQVSILCMYDFEYIISHSIKF